MNTQTDFFNYRAWFSKTGASTYMSHLDIMRYFTRLFRRAGLPVWHTEGFNPHPYLNFGLPLPLGVWGLGECVDFRLTEYNPPEAVRLALVNDPALIGSGERGSHGVAVTGVTFPVHKTGEIAFADYEFVFSEDIRQPAADFFARERIQVIKKSKNKQGKGDSQTQTDIKPDIARFSFEEKTLMITLCASPAKTLSPGLVSGAFREFAGLSATRITRAGLLLQDFSPFC
ncbi:MAG: TIGR03936 family radical SAM-associated protein [Oscillospiraceae bacterium]|jgi:radical SAM-linked protein|nr:TIGR03936 family radical SAM-associated protein [Oscillospiraceae bacterium]